MLVGLGHLDLVCRDLDRSLAFYAAVLGPLGLEPPHLVPGERGEQIHYLRFPVPGSGSLGLRQALDEQPFELYAPGLHHLAFAVESDAEVDAVHAAAVTGGAHMWMEERGKPINAERVAEAAETGAETLAVACPFCTVMLDDGVRETGEAMRVADVATLLAESL